MGHFARECRAPRSQDRGRRENFKQGSKTEEQAPKALMAIDGVGWDWSYMANKEEHHALVADQEAPTEFALMAKSSSKNKVSDNSLCSKACKKNTDSLNTKITKLSEILNDNDTITDYSRPSPSIESNSNDLQSSTSSISKNGNSSSSILSKPVITFVKTADSPTVIKTNKDETVRKSFVKYAEMYRKTSKSSNVRAYDCGVWVDQGKHGKRIVILIREAMNKLVRNNLVRGLPSKCFENDHTCVACLKGKQHKASCKTKLLNSVSKPLHTLHMDLFGPTSVSSLNHKWYCLVVTDDFSRFTWTFFLKTKDETSGFLRNFITEIENLKDLKVKIIRCDNGGEFRNKEMNDFCYKKGTKREFSNARTPKQNGVTKRRNKTLIEAARTMLADAKLSVTF
nr:putative ribonuclease H-like domain-containing protein [Tanacetum cinerariifolium]